ncbi:MAG: hypothetical protein E2O75_00730 [Chloroflexi bacterium]|nr:MAG: hypothetical protein E2O75_00730 [Chloroflexota bacterium]
MDMAPRSLLVAVLLLLAAASLALGLQCQPKTGENQQNGVQTSSEDLAPVLGELPTFTLTDQTGNTFGSDQLRGKVWIATFIFTRSRETTPQQIAQMKELQKHLETQPVWPGIRLVSITAEPELDTPEVLRTFARQAGADSTHWKFLTGPREEIFTLCEQGFNLPVREEARTAQRPITHNPQFVLVDRKNRIRGYYDGLTLDGLNELILSLDLVLPELPETDGAGAVTDKATPEHTQLALPPENIDLPWLESRRAAQWASVDAFKVFYDFRFDDRREESGIRFRHKIVNNAGKDWMPNHYDHGNGLAIADVDGDGLHDIYFTTQVGGNELWRNLGGGQFENITQAAGGLGIDERISVTASFADIDNDGDPDLYVTTVRGGNLLFENDGTGAFTDISATSGIDYTGHSSAAVFFDYNRDGLLDLFLVNVGIYTRDIVLPVTNGTSPEQEDGRFQFFEGNEDAFIAHRYPERAERSILYKNVGGNRFVDVTEEVGLLDESWSGDATPLDINDDGWLDLYVLNMQGNDEYYENVDGVRFVKKSRAVFPKTPWGSMSINVFDYDNDGKMDLYITDMHSDMSEDIGPEREKLKSRMQWPDSLLQTDGQSIFGNAFYHNQGNGTFNEISDQIGAENYWPWGLSVGDLNADGYEDVFIASSMNFPFRYGVNTVLLNNQGEGFLDSEYILGVEPRRGERRLTPWFTLDCSTQDLENLYCRGRSGPVLVWAALGSRSSVIFDLDNDGDLDIVTNDFNSEPLVLISNLTDQNDVLHFLKVKLVGTTSNRDGLGATVKVSAGGNTYVQVHDGQSGYLSQSTYPLYFGLNDAETVDQIEVQWPSGQNQVVSGPIATNTQIEVTEQ